MTWRKGAALLLVALPAGGCNSDRDSDYQAYLQMMRQAVHQSFGSGSVSRAAAAAVPYASMGVRIDNQAENLIVLASDANGEQLWTSKAHIVLQTRDGRVLRSVGLAHDLSALTSRSENALSPASALKGPVDNSLSYDLQDIGAYAAPVRCRMSAQRPETIVILGNAIPTMRVAEVCDSTALGWHFTNYYWVQSDNGFVWRTQQHLHPQGGLLRTEIFRPPSGPS